MEKLNNNILCRFTIRFLEGVFIGGIISVLLAGMTYNYFTFVDDCRIELFVSQISLVFIITSIVTILSNNSKNVYWVDIVQYKLISPKYFGIIDISSYNFSLLVISTIAFLFNFRFILFSFILTLALMMILSAKLVTSYFGIVSLQLELSKKYDKVKKDVNEVLTYNKYKRDLISNTYKAIDNKDINTFCDNISFLLNKDEIDDFITVYNYAKAQSYGFSSNVFEIDNFIDFALKNDELFNFIIKEYNNIVFDDEGTLNRFFNFIFEFHSKVLKEIISNNENLNNINSNSKYNFPIPIFKKYFSSSKNYFNLLDLFLKKGIKTIFKTLSSVDNLNFLDYVITENNVNTNFISNFCFFELICSFFAYLDDYYDSSYKENDYLPLVKILIAMNKIFIEFDENLNYYFKNDDNESKRLVKFYLTDSIDKYFLVQDFPYVDKEGNTTQKKWKKLRDEITSVEYKSILIKIINPNKYYKTDNFNEERINNTFAKKFNEVFLKPIEDRLKINDKDAKDNNNKKIDEFSEDNCLMASNNIDEVFRLISVYINEFLLK